MTETLFDYEVQLRQSRLHDSTSDKKSSSNDFDTRFADFLSVAGKPDCESCDTSQSFDKQEFFQPPPREEADYRQTDYRQDDYAIDYNRDDDEIFRQENYPQTDNHSDDNSLNDNHSDDYRRDDVDNDEGYSRYDNDDDVSADADKTHIVENDTKPADAEQDASKQDNTEQDNSAENSGQENLADTANQANKGEQPIVAEAVDTSALQNTAALQAETASANLASDAAQTDTLAKFGHLVNNNPASQNQQGNQNSNAAQAQSNAGINQAQTANLSAKVELQVEVNSSRAPAVQSFQASLSKTEPQLAVNAPAVQSNIAQANNQNNPTANNPTVNNPTANNPSLQGANNPASTEKFAEKSASNNSAAINNGQQNATGATSATPLNISAKPATETVTPTANDNGQASAGQIAQATTAESANLQPQTQNAQAHNNGSADTAQVDNASNTGQGTILDELPIVPHKQIAPVITLPTEKSAVPETLQQSAPQSVPQSATSGQANTGKLAKAVSADANANTSANAQSNSGQKLSDVPIESITVTKIQPVAKQVKNVAQPLRVNGEQLLQTQEQGGSKLLQDLKLAENAPASASARAEKSVFDARNITQNQQNTGQASIPAQQVADKTLRGTVQAEPQNASNNNVTQNIAAATRQNAGGEQQAQQNPQQQQPQSQPQQSSLSAQANSNGQPSGTASSDTLNNSFASRFASNQSQEALQQTHKLHQQISLKIQNAHQAQEKRINIQLRPVELGRVDIQIETLANGKLQLTIAPEKSETLELLQRDASTLQQALQDSGLDVDGKDLNFLLRQEFAEHRKNSQQSSSNNKQNGENGEDENQPSTDDTLDEYVNISDDGRINARV